MILLKSGKKRHAAYALLVFLLVFLSACGTKGTSTESEAVITAESADQTPEAAVAETAVAETAGETTGETAGETTAVMTSTAAESTAQAKAKEEIYIIYTNDVHSYIYNEITDEDKNTKPGLRYSSVAALKKKLQNEGKNVLLADAGDEIQGNIYGVEDKGKTVIQLMNLAGYDLAVPGNHEFDYEMQDLFDRISEAQYPYLSCSFVSMPDHKAILESTKLFDFNGTKVAFIGISTPETLRTTSPVKFKDSSGNAVYSFLGAVDPQELYDAVQKAVDSVRQEADYVIAVGHLGVENATYDKGVASLNVIAETEGIDAFIDGHSHTVMEKNYVKNKAGKDVLLTQTGSYLDAIGLMTIAADGQITTSLITEVEDRDETLAAVEDAYNQKLDDMMGQTFAFLGTKMAVTDPDGSGTRVVRFRETNLGDLLADTYYWYINEVSGIDCDVTIQNAGGIRAEMEAGYISYKDAKSVCPFGNQVCVINVTGQQLLDILENGVMEVGNWDKEKNAPAERGAFMHVAGLCFTVDASIPSSVVLDEEEQFISVCGQYRVKDLKIYNRESGSYEAVDLDKVYRLGGLDHSLRNSGSGLGFLSENECVADYLGTDADLLAAYLKSFTAVDSMPQIYSGNSPLASWQNYLIDYENQEGAGRIRQINLTY